MRVVGGGWGVLTGRSETIVEAHYQWKWASQVVQWSRIRLTTQEMQVWSLDQGDPLEEEMTTLSSIFTRKAMDRGASRVTVPWSHKKLDTTEQLSTHISENRSNLSGPK